MTENKKQIADHHDDVIRLKTGYELIVSDWEYFRDRSERNDLYMKTSRDRVVDMKINNYDKIIDLEMFLLKVFIPILGISFATGENIFGIDTYTLKMISLSIIILVGLFMAITIMARKGVVDSEQKFHEQQLDFIKKSTINKAERLENRIKKFEARFEEFEKDLKIALENEPNL